MRVGIPFTRPLLVMAVILLSAFSAAQTAPPDTQGVRYGPLVNIFADPMTVPADQRLADNAVCIGCELTIEGRVDGNVVVVFGKVRLLGDVNGDVVGVFSGLDLRGGHVRRQAFNILGSVDTDGARLGGVVDLGVGDWLTDLPSPVHVVAFFVRWGRTLSLLLAFLLVGLIAALAPARVRAIGEVVPLRYGTAFFVGLLGYLAALAALTLLSVTLIGLPIGWALFKLLKWLGATAVFWAVGHRLGRGLGRDLSVTASVFVGFVPYAVAMLAPLWFGAPGLALGLLFGLFSWLFLEVPALGLALLTRFGTRTPPPAGPAPQES